MIAAVMADLEYLTGLDLPRCQQFFVFGGITCKDDAAARRGHPYDQRAFISVTGSTAADRCADDLQLSIAQGIITARLRMLDLRFGVSQQGLYICRRRLLRQNDFPIGRFWATATAPPAWS